MTESEHINGYWYLPTQSDITCSGQLVFGPSNPLRLTLTAHPEGDLWAYSFTERNYTIWGHDIKTGERITLFHCNRLDSGRQIAVFNAQYIVFGQHVSSVGLKKFDAVSFSFINFDKWIGISGFTTENQSFNSYTLRYQNPSDITFKIDEIISGSISFQNNHPQFSTSNINLTQESFVKLKFSQPNSLEETLDAVWKFQQFVTLMMFEQTKVKWIIIKDGEKRMRVFYNQNNKEIEDSMHNLSFLPFRLVRFKIAFALTKWYGLTAEINPVIEILHSNIGSNKEFVHNNFLNIIQAVEAFHRRKVQLTEQLKLKNKERLDRILAQIGDDPDKDWLEQKLAYSHEPGLTSRLNELIRNHKNVLFIEAPRKKSLKKLINSIVDKRNYLTHYDPSHEMVNNDVDSETIQLVNHTYFLKLLLTFCILDKIGFSGNFLIDNIFKRYRVRLK